MQKAQTALDSYTPPVIAEPENLPDYNRRGNASDAYRGCRQAALPLVPATTAAEKSRLEAEHAERHAASWKAMPFSPKSRRSRTRKSALRNCRPSSALPPPRSSRWTGSLPCARSLHATACQAITESVNSKFRLTRWRLFTEQVNGRPGGLL